jgi:hypothetical protein
MEFDLNGFPDDYDSFTNILFVFYINYEFDSNELSLSFTTVFQFFVPPDVTSSLTRGRVCHLQLLLVFASAVIIRSESHETNDHILLFRIDTPLPPEGQAHVFISPTNRAT